MIFYLTVLSLENITKTEAAVTVRTAVALGVFDGIHIGHRAVLGRAIEFEKSGLEPSVFTFNTESISVKHNKKYKYIASNEEKLYMMSDMGIKYVCCPEFSDIREISAEDFVLKVIKKKFNAAVVVCGQRFRFGRDAGCGADQLISLGKKYGFEVSVVDPVMYENVIVSSSSIKDMLYSGDIKKANKLLGYNYGIDQKVVHGRQIGCTIDFPTINQYFLSGQVIPRYGVYASQTLINGRQYLSITNIGVKPTVTDDMIPLAETHILDYNADLYNKTVKVRFSDFIRSEKRFQSLDELKKAIAADISTVKALGGYRKDG